MLKTWFLGLGLVVLCAYRSGDGPTPSSDDGGRMIADQWQPFHTMETGGVLGHHLDLWRNNRLWYVENSGFLLSGFEHRPGEHIWQGEHVGKWLHAAVLACSATGDQRLKRSIDSTVDGLIASQLSNGYMGTYLEKDRFYEATTDTSGWDVWTHRYNLYGLLVYDKYFPNQKVVDACKKMGDLLIDAFGNGKADITKYGTRHGISSTTLIESIMMLYERTKEKRYLDFAEHIVDESEKNPGLRLMGDMLQNKSVVYPGNGKAYQLMANLLGYIKLYEATGKDKYLQTVLTAWQQIHDKHLLVTGGPWTRKTDYNRNKECFAFTEAFDPSEIVVENCCTVTWIQMNLHLSELTGEARYAEEAEKAVFNHLFNGQHSEGIDWCYYTKPNQTTPPYVPKIHCCASSGPRALEMFASHLVGQSADHLSVNYFSPATIALDDRFGGGKLEIKSNFPLTSSADIVFNTSRDKEFVTEFRLPHGSSLASVKVNGKAVRPVMNKRGYYEVKNKWKKGDVLSVSLNYELQAHVQEGGNGKKWVAFSYGPVVLAQKISEDQSEEPFKGINAANSNKMVAMLTPLQKSGENMAFGIRNTSIKLIPYFETGSRTSGPRAYFECAK